MIREPQQDGFFSRDGKRLLGLIGSGEGAKVWDAMTGVELLKLIGVGPNYAVSPDGTRLASFRSTPAVTSGEIEVWDLTTGQLLHRLQGHSSAVTRVTFSPDGKRLASCTGYPSSQIEVKLWDSATGSELLNLSLDGRGAFNGTLTFSPDGTRLLLSDSTSRWPASVCQVWDATPRR
jgi:WD40 repeat protein